MKIVENYLMLKANVESASYAGFTNAKGKFLVVRVGPNSYGLLDKNLRVQDICNTPKWGIIDHILFKSDEPIETLDVKIFDDKQMAVKWLLEDN